MTAILTGTGGAIGGAVGDAQGRQMQRKYDQNMARDSQVSRRIAAADKQIAEAKTANVNLRQTLARLRRQTDAATVQAARQQRVAAQKLARRSENDLVEIDESRERARTLNLRQDYAKLTKQRAQLVDQNERLESTIGQLKSAEPLR